MMLGVPVTPRRKILFAAKGLITLVLLVFIFGQMDVARIYERLQQARIGMLGAACLLIGLNIPLVAFRWWLLLRSSAGGKHVGFGLALQATWIGLFFGQVLPGAVGGDVVKGWLAYRGGVRRGTVITTVVVDRISAMLGLITLMLLSFYAILGSGVPELGLSAAVVAALFLLGALGLITIAPVLAQMAARRWLKLGRFHDLLLMIRGSMLSATGTYALLISIFLHSSTAFAVAMAAEAFGIRTSLAEVLAILPLSMLLSAVPISLAGWGIREASMVLGFTAFGMPAEDAALLSIWLGLSVLLSSVPGGILWGFGQSR